MSRRPLQRIQATLVAKRYFLDKRTKTQIAEDLGISRFKVARLIDAAVDEGLVRFVISEPGDLDTDLSEAVRRRFSLQNALILNGPDLPTAELTEPLGTVAAQLLEELLIDGQVLGVAWGRVLAATARKLTQLAKVDVVQVAGGLASLEYAQNPMELVHRMAKLSGGRAYPLYVPMWTEDSSLVGRLRGEPSVSNVLKMYDRIDVLVVGIGSWDPPESCLCSTFPAAWLERARQGNVHADLCATLIDAAGQAVANALDDVAIALNTEQLRKIPNVVGIGGGAEKAGAIAAALRGGWIDTLVTDAGVARKLLAG